MGSFERALARGWKTTGKFFGCDLKSGEFLQKDAMLHFFQLKIKINFVSHNLLKVGYNLAEREISDLAC